MELTKKWGTKTMKNNLDISIVIPAFNEANCIKMLYEKIIAVLGGLNKSFEIIYVDDGSCDGTDRILKDLAANDHRLKAIIFRRNFGQTAALDAGIKSAQGKIIVTMDADLQNDPADIPRLIDELSKGYDCVSGWRYPRRDSFMRNLLSRLADKLRRFIVNDGIHDSGCTLKAYKKDCFNNLNLYGEMHRFIPAILKRRGIKIGKVKVTHHSRIKGKSKYSLTRLVKGSLDLLVLRFWMQYSARPIHLFGVMGIIMMIFGFICGIYLTFVKFYRHIPLAGRPLLFLTVLLLVVGVQFIVLGILTDIMVQIYYGSEDRKVYNIKETLG